MTVDSMPFDFARDLRKREIRERLTLLGFDSGSGDVVMVWQDGEYFLGACRRAPADDDVRRTLLVWPEPTSLGGWGMRWAEEVER